MHFRHVQYGVLGSSTVVGESSLVLEHGLCVSVVVCDFPLLHPWTMEGCVKLLIG